MGTLGYYSTIARLAPGGLAKGMARRVQGVARQALYRRRERLEEPRLLEVFGAATADELAGRALSARPGQAWCEVGRRASVLEALAELPGARERALERARAALRGEFDVFGTRVCFGEGQPVDWSRDPVSGYRYPVLPVERLRMAQPGVDPKYPWVLGRLDCLVALGQGYWVERHEEARAGFARAFVARTLDFLQANPVGQGVHWTCAMEVALRAANLAQALVMFSDAPEARRPEFLVPVLESLAEHTAWVEAHLEDQGRGAQQPPRLQLRGAAGGGAALPGAAGRAEAGGARGGGAAHADGGAGAPGGHLLRGLRALPPAVGGALHPGAGGGAGPGVDLGAKYVARLRRMYAGLARLVLGAGAGAAGGGQRLGPRLPLPGAGRARAGLPRAAGRGALRGREASAEGPFPDEAAWLLGLPGLERFRALPAAPARGLGELPGRGLPRAARGGGGGDGERRRTGPARGGRAQPQRQALLRAAPARAARHRGSGHGHVHARRRRCATRSAPRPCTTRSRWTAWSRRRWSRAGSSRCPRRRGRACRCSSRARSWIASPCATTATARCPRPWASSAPSCWTSASARSG